MCVFPLIESIPQGVTACLYADTMKVCWRVCVRVSVCVRVECITLQTLSLLFNYSPPAVEAGEEKMAGEEELLVTLVRLFIFNVLLSRHPSAIILITFRATFVYMLLKDSQ